MLHFSFNCVYVCIDFILFCAISTKQTTILRYTLCLADPPRSSSQAELGANPQDDADKMECDSVDGSVNGSVEGSVDPEVRTRCPVYGSCDRQHQ